MRTIKFRGKSKDDGKWCYGGYAKRHDGRIFITSTSYGTDGFYIIPETLGEFTGLKDKNGKEIYEGDIIKYKYYYAFKKWWSHTDEIPLIKKCFEKQKKDYVTKKSKVYYEDGCFRLKYSLLLKDIRLNEHTKIGRAQMSGDFEEKYWDFEIIGNIYENPELTE